MPQKQTIMWTALPNGVKSGGGVLQLSVFVSPRLETGEGLPRPQLSQFPDWVNWTAKVQGVKFAVQFEGGAATPATVVGPALEPDLWTALFKPTSYVEPYSLIDYSGHLIHAFPVANVSNFVKAQYQQVGAASLTAYPARSAVSKQLAAVSLYDASSVQPASATLPHAALGAQAAGKQPRTAAIPSTLQNYVRTLPPQTQTSATRHLNGLTLRSLPVSSEAATAFQSVYQELQQRRAVRASTPPQPARDLLQVRMHYPKLEAPITPLQPPDIDFHKVISTLGNYPELMRRLGLIIDLEIPLPAGVSSSTVKVLPTWATDSPPSAFNTDFSPRTACLVDTGKGQFYARPETPASKIVNGLLNLSDEVAYPVGHMDVPGSALKMTDLADRLVTQPAAASVSTAARPMMLTTGAAKTSANAPANANTAPATVAEATTALPALRTAGISLAQTNRADWLANVFSKAALNNKAVAANTPDQVIHYADDLVRGYRVDVWDAQSQTWRSLCRRKGTYNFFEANLTRQYDDEGFVQLGVTKPVTDSTLGAELPKDLYLQEAMFTWNGWSLSAPRPGKSVAPDGTPQRLDDPATAQSRASNDFKMIASFVPPPGTLPRLRFGNTYRFRARVVDLAGNGLPPDGPSASDFSKATAPHLYTRMEPVVSPLVVLTKSLDGAKSPGESLGRMVLRSNYDKSAPDYAALYGPLVSDPEYTGFALRLIAPPKTSQLMAERHAMFDSQSGAMKKDATTFQMISAKAEGAFPLDPLTRLPMQKSLDIPYLPDPLSRGAVFILLDANNQFLASVPTINFYASGADWPSAVPFLLKVVEGTGKTAAHWDESSRTLSVQMAKAEVATVALSSHLGDGDLGTRNQQSMGVWAWIREAAPANLAQLQQGVAAGRAWMLTPSRPISLVHAVQQPLIAPQFHALTPNRSLGETFAYIVDDQPMPIDGKSTQKVDFEATWQEPWDDVNDANGPKTIQGSLHLLEWKLRREETAIEILAAIATPVHTVALPAATKTPAKSGKEKPVTLAVHEKANTAQLQAVSAAAVTSAKLAPGTMIPVDLRAFRPPEELAPTLKLGYSFRHDFGDTKYRKVSYSAVAATRFAEYFPIKDAAQLSRVSPNFDVDVPNSARPARPSVLYAVPTFGWQRQTQVQFDKSGIRLGPVTLPGVKGVGTISQRSGGGLRIYLDRPWYSSGAGELLGVIIWPSPTPLQLRTVPTAANRRALPEVPEPLKSLVTQWGIDPIWQSSPLPQDFPRLENFKNVVKSGEGLTLDELADMPEPSSGMYKVGVAGYAPQFDKDRGLWYCDVEMDFGDSYFPFVRLALARYQPISVENAHLSRVVQADFAQLAPDRTATVIYDPKNPKKVDVAIVGLSYAATAQGKGPSVVEVGVETKPVGADGDLGWVPVPESTNTIRAQVNGNTTIWRAEIRLDRYKVPKLQEVRLVVREYEVMLADATQPQLGIAVVPTQATQRLVYADVLNLPPMA